MRSRCTFDDGLVNLELRRNAPRMNQSPVLIVSDHTDAHVPMVGRHLDRMNVPFIRLNVSDFPSRTRLSISSTDLEFRTILHVSGESALDCRSIRSIWYRKPEPYRLAASVPATQRDFAMAECREAVRGLYNSLADRFWIDDPTVMQRSSNKPLQLNLARRLGFDVPRTMVTNSRTTAREFFDACNGVVIYKTLSAPAVQTATGGPGDISRNIAAFTTLIADDDPELWASVELAPCMFQELIDKRLEVRATVIGGQVFAAEIHSQRETRSAIDWRRGTLTNLEHRVHGLPESIAELCRQLLQNSGCSTEQLI